MTSSPPGRAARVLIVDDERANRELLMVMLAPEGYQLSMASSGDEALAMVSGDPPDLVVLDVMMPGLNGYAVTARIKANKATTHVRVLILSSLDDNSSRTHGAGAGAEGFLSKPVDRRALCEMVRRLLSAPASVASA